MHVNCVHDDVKLYLSLGNPSILACLLKDTYHDLQINYHQRAKNSASKLRIYVHRIHESPDDVESASRLPRAESESAPRSPRSYG